MAWTDEQIKKYSGRHKHYPGKWFCEGRLVLVKTVTEDAQSTYNVLSGGCAFSGNDTYPHNVKRLVACVNALQGRDFEGPTTVELDKIAESPDAREALALACQEIVGAMKAGRL